MKYSQMNLRSGLMARVQRKLDESQEKENNIINDDNNDVDNLFSIQSTPICQPNKIIKVRQRERGKQNMGWMLR